MGWPAPSQRTGRLPVLIPNERERTHEDCYAWHRTRQEPLQFGGSRRDRSGSFSTTHETRVSVAVHGPARKLHSGDRSLLWRTPSWPATHSAGACCSADVPRVCAALCEGPKERRARRGSDRRSSNTAYYEVCRGQERGAARSSV